ncbi:MAG: cadherin repeat domain-containing protein [Planctomycetes bacterium]|nr:cadherin repeat domain-containing protein [Planctomycetota bacterium]
MQMREKVLAGGLVSAVAFYFLPVVWDWFVAPVDDAERTLAVAEKIHDDRDYERLRVLTKQRLLKEWKGRSLSPKPQDAARNYLQWLTALAEDVGEFSNVQVTPDPVAAAANQPFVTVRFKLKADATMAQVRQFLFRFFQTDLLHSITQLELVSPAATGNPKLTVNMSFEALSLKDAPPRGQTLFARTEVADDWQDPTQPLTVRHSEGFPTRGPFQVRVGKHYFDVTEVAGNSWTVKPQVTATQSTSARTVSLLAEDPVELAPVHPDFLSRTISDFDPLLKRNPFVKPVPYAPKLEIAGSKSFPRGGSLELTCRALGFDLSLGEPIFTLEGDAPSGMSLNGRSGKLTWKPNDEQALGDFKLNVIVKAAGLKEQLKQELVVSLKQSNKPPKFESVSERHAVLGKEFSMPVKATDEDPDTKLSYSLAAGAPEGATINAETGEFKWTPPATIVPGPVKLTVQVVDNGNPPNTVKQEVTITVGDDLAQFTELTGIFDKNGKREFWLSDKSTNRLIVLKEGEKLSYANIAATVVRIDKKSVLFKRDDALWRLDLGDTLKKLRKLEPAAAPELPKKQS